MPRNVSTQILTAKNTVNYLKFSYIIVCLFLKKTCHFPFSLPAFFLPGFFNQNQRRHQHQNPHPKVDNWSLGSSRWCEIVGGWFEATPLSPWKMQRINLDWWNGWSILVWNGLIFWGEFNKLIPKIDRQYLKPDFDIFQIVIFFVSLNFESVWHIAVVCFDFFWDVWNTCSLSRRIFWWFLGEKLTLQSLDGDNLFFGSQMFYLQDVFEKVNFK